MSEISNSGLIHWHAYLFAPKYAVFGYSLL